MYPLVSAVIATALLIGAPVTAAAQTAKSESGSATLSVCDVFANLDAYSGKLVEIRRMLSTSKEWFDLRDPACGSAFKGQWKDWPRAIHLVLASPGVQPATALALDRGALQHAGIVLRFFGEVTPHELGVEVTFTALGRLRSIRDRSPTVNRSIPSEGLGFGHLSSFPAELVCEGMKDIALRSVR